MTVNPKKLKPYDTPPKRRRSLIPEAPDSAATGFFVAAALWLALATALGVLIADRLRVAGVARVARRRPTVKELAGG